MDGFSTFQIGMKTTKKKLLRAVRNTKDLTVIVGPGNIGDLLIQEGTRKLLMGVKYKEVARNNFKKISGDTALIKKNLKKQLFFLVFLMFLKALFERP